MKTPYYLAVNLWHQLDEEMQTIQNRFDFKKRLNFVDVDRLRDVFKMRFHFHCHLHYYHINMYICKLYNSMSSSEELANLEGRFNKKTTKKTTLYSYSVI